jgi:hypothetical protein
MVEAFLSTEYLADVEYREAQFFFTSRLRGEPAEGVDDIHFNPAARPLLPRRPRRPLLSRLVKARRLQPALAAGVASPAPGAFVRVTVGAGRAGRGHSLDPGAGNPLSADARALKTSVSETAFPEAWVQGVPPPHPPDRARIAECGAGVLTDLTGRSGVRWDSSL